MDIIPANGRKGLGIEKVLDYVPFTKEEAIAFGDGTNDIEMLQAVGTGHRHVQCQSGRVGCNLRQCEGGRNLLVL